jgi:threonine dehydrogenase-like Zn-dependent dehydrogenase
MRAVLTIDQDTFHLTDIPIPTPGYGEVLLRVYACGVCNSEVHLLQTLAQPVSYAIHEVPVGPQPGMHDWQVRRTVEEANTARSDEPLLLGHEVSGQVETLGEGVSGVQIGQRVTALAQRGFAEYVVVRAANLVPLPNDLPFHLALGEPIGCAVNAAIRAKVEIGDTVGMVGTGFMGLLLLQLLAQCGAARVVAIDLRSSARTLAQQLGADIVIDPVQEDPMEAMLRLTEGKGADVVIEATGNQAGLTLASNLTRTRGRLVIYGYHQGDSRTVDMQLWNLRGLDVVNAHQRDDAEYLAGMRRGIAMLKYGKLRTAPLVTHRFPLEQTAEAFALAAKRPEHFIKAVVEPTEASSQGSF